MRKLHLSRVVAFFAPLVIAVVLTKVAAYAQAVIDMDKRLDLKMLYVQSAEELAAAFDELGYGWPPEEGEVPAVAVKSLPKDMDKIADVRVRKELFFRTLLPIVMAENRVIKDLRQHAKKLIRQGVVDLSMSQRHWLEAIADYYKVQGDLSLASKQEELLLRLDSVPVSLVLAQAANESAWGTSRFARLGNNLFGQWTYRQSEGIVPKGRPQGEHYAVKTFSSIDASVRAYLHNLNTHAAYNEFRQLRQQMRSDGLPLDGYGLAAGLLEYSIRGKDYVDEIRNMMEGNRLLPLEEGSIGLHQVS